ncbi:hypothetical protein GJU39_10705 [Pedobacter petrophilus]|uniref:Uncharacterized protein n=1 Tax=Pedobacter petrophilus TaxID=1908241 RepID=A0A7K0FYV8_9SPHI|nr:hypothetical protein [Pedobacter petrophilus]
MSQIKKNKVAFFLFCIFLIVHSSCNNQKTSDGKDTVRVADSLNRSKENLTEAEKSESQITLDE